MCVCLSVCLSVCLCVYCTPARRHARTYRVYVARDVEAELSVQRPGQGVRQEAVPQAEGPGLIDLGVEGWIDAWMLCR